MLKAGGSQNVPVPDGILTRLLKGEQSIQAK